MSVGTPVVVTEKEDQRQFALLPRVSVGRNDPHSFDESLLQELIDSTPHVLPVREFLPSTTHLFSLGREIPLDLGGFLGRIDNLLVTNDGYLVVVEAKLNRNQEGIREVIVQTLQYGMAISQMPLMELEARIKRGHQAPLRSTESIRDCVTRVATDQNLTAFLADDFEEAVELHLRRGEILLLIVSDGIHVGVERVTHWLNEQGNSSPFKFGLVELKFHTLGSQRLVIPRTILKTREISRHVVVVDVRPNVGITATTEVTDEFMNAAGGRLRETRSVKAAPPPMTKNQLVQLVASEDRERVSNLLSQLEIYPFDVRGTASYLQIGFHFPDDGSDFHPLAYLGKGGVWAYPLQALRKALGISELVTFHREANQFGLFYRNDQLDDPNSTGCEVKYRQLQDSDGQFAAFLNSYRIKAIGLLEAGVTS